MLKASKTEEWNLRVTCETLGILQLAMHCQAITHCVTRRSPIRGHQAFLHPHLNCAFEENSKSISNLPWHHGWSKRSCKDRAIVLPARETKAGAERGMHTQGNWPPCANYFFSIFSSFVATLVASSFGGYSSAFTFAMFAHRFASVGWSA